MKEGSRYPVIIYPVEEGGYVAEVPALKGCLAQGETEADCLEELKKVQALWLESAKRNTKKYPARRKLLPNCKRWWLELIRFPEYSFPSNLFAIRHRF